MLKINSEQVGKVLFYGFSNISKYRQNYKERRKRLKSVICLAAIFIGTVIGGLIPSYIVPEIIPFVSHTIGFKPNWLIATCTCVSFASFGSTICFIITKYTYQQYNNCRYGHTNKQYTDLTQSEINNIQDADWNFGDNHNITITDENIKNIHANMVKFIKTNKKASDRQGLKTAHRRFRDGEVKYALLTQPPILSEVISAELIKNNTIDGPNDLVNLTKYASIPKWIKYLKDKVQDTLNELNDFENIILLNYEPTSSPPSARTSPDLDPEFDLEKGTKSIAMRELN